MLGATAVRWGAAVVREKREAAKRNRDENSIGITLIESLEVFRYVVTEPSSDILLGEIHSTNMEALGAHLFLYRQQKVGRFKYAYLEAHVLETPMLIKAQVEPLPRTDIVPGSMSDLDRRSLWDICKVRVIVPTSDVSELGAG